MNKYTTVLIPAYNEEDRIEETLHAIKDLDCIDRIIVLDDGSTDGTYSLVSKLGVEIYRFDSNRGKGEALKYGINKVIDHSDIIVFLDGDIGKTAREVERLILPVSEGRADVTIAKFPSAKKKGGFGLVKNLAKYGVKMLTGKTVHTALSGQRAFRAEVLQKLKSFPPNYGIEVGMIIDILKMDYRVKEVEVHMTHRETGRDLKGFIHRGKQFYQILCTLTKKQREG